jgi:hypothetical protein
MYRIIVDNIYSITASAAELLRVLISPLRGIIL